MSLSTSTTHCVCSWYPRSLSVSALPPLSQGAPDLPLLLASPLLCGPGSQNLPNIIGDSHTLMQVGFHRGKETRIFLVLELPGLVISETSLNAQK